MKNEIKNIFELWKYLIRKNGNSFRRGVMGSSRELFGHCYINGDDLLSC